MGFLDKSETLSMQEDSPSSNPGPMRKKERLVDVRKIEWKVGILQFREIASTAEWLTKSKVIFRS